MQIRRFVPIQDTAAAWHLWQGTLGQAWPLTEERFGCFVTPEHGEHFLAWEGDRAVGLACTQIVQGVRPAARSGHLTALLVASDRQGRGIGTALHETALAHLSGAGLQVALLGRGRPRLWPGAPCSRSDGAGFFAARGWDLTPRGYDLVLDLARYVTPDGLWAQARAQGVTVELLRPGEFPALMAFMAQEFPGWLAAYQTAARLGDEADCLVIRGQADRIVGALLLWTPLSQPVRMQGLWGGILGEAQGGLACVGIAERLRGEGLGRMLIARGTELLIERGARCGFIAWTGSPGFYGKLGYRVWEEYAMGQRTL
jgi:ribosomal protein S18 acetylase RimI-like enzyme